MLCIIYIFICMCVHIYIAQYTYIHMYPDYFPSPILYTSCPQLVEPLLFLSFSLKTSWEKLLTKNLKSSQMLLVTNWHEKTHQLADRIIRDHRFHTDLE